MLEAGKDPFIKGNAKDIKAALNRVRMEAEEERQRQHFAEKEALRRTINAEMAERERKHFAEKDAARRARDEGVAKRDENHFKEKLGRLGGHSETKINKIKTPHDYRDLHPKFKPGENAYLDAKWQPGKQPELKPTDKPHDPLGLEGIARNVIDRFLEKKIAPPKKPQG